MKQKQCLTTARYEKAGFAKLVDASATMGANLALAGLKKMAAAVVQLGGSVLIWHMIEWFSMACCLYLYAARSKNENRP
jgi:hypothetical protein